jgi:hypothetical protein
VYNRTYLAGAGRDNHNGAGRILSKVVLLTILVLRPLLAEFAGKDQLGFHKILKGIVLTVYNLKQEVSISV